MNNWRLVIGNWKLKMALIAILIIASFLRLYNFTELPPGLYPDEAMNGNNALESLASQHWKWFYPENNGREGLFINIQSAFVAALGNQPWALRLPSAIFGILTVLGVYFLAKELFRENYQLPITNFQKERTKIRHWKLGIENYKVALLASFLIATSFWHVNFSRIGFRAIMAPLLLTWGIYLLLRAFRKPHWFAPLIAGFIYGLGFHTYIAYRATPVLILAVLWLMRKKYGWEPVLRIGFIFTVVAFLVFLPLGIYFIQNPADFFGRTVQVSIFSSPTLLKDFGGNVLKTAGMFNFSGDWNWRHNIAGRPLLFFPVGVFFLVGIFYGIYQIIKGFKISSFQFLISKQIPITHDQNQPKLKNDPPQADTTTFHFSFFILIFWLIVAALPVVISNESLPHALRAILMAPPVFILAAIGGIKVYELLKSKIDYRLSVIGVFLILLFLIFKAYYSYFITWGQNPNVAANFNADYVAIGREINRLPKELAKYVVVEAPGIMVRGVPMPAQTVMFITDTFMSEKQKAKNLTYLLPEELNQIPANQEKYITYIK